MEQQVEFKAWPKIPRVKSNTITITEKIDGTNACVIIRDGEVIGYQSRNRLIKPGDDNMGFAAWASENREELSALGEGYHFGEWAGPGIQKNPHMLTEKQFFLFNVMRPFDTLPECVNQVPVLYQGPEDPEVIADTMTDLWTRSKAEGYIPEGIIIYHHDMRSYRKATFLNSDGKWKAQQ
jgi:hypothetical protein